MTQPDMDKAQLELVKKELQDKMKELEAKQKPRARSLLLAEEDRLMLENISLREELFRMKIEQEKRDAQMLILGKYDINPNIEKVSVDLEERVVNITSLE